MSAYLLATIIAGSADTRYPNVAERKLLDILRARDVLALRPHMERPVRLRIVWNVSSDRAREVFAQRFSKEQSGAGYSYNVVYAGEINYQTPNDLAQRYLTSFAGFRRDYGRDSMDFRLFYYANAYRNALCQMIAGSIFFECEILTPPAKAIQITRLSLNGHSLGAEDYWRNQ